MAILFGFDTLLLNLNITTLLEVNLERIRQRGIIKEIQRGDNFLVALADHTSHVVKAYLSGKMRIKKITLCVGDEVDIELSPYDLTRGRIVWRHKT